MLVILQWGKILDFFFVPIRMFWVKCQYFEPLRSCLGLQRKIIFRKINAILSILLSFRGKNELIPCPDFSFLGVLFKI